MSKSRNIARSMAWGAAKGIHKRQMWNKRRRNGRDEIGVVVMIGILVIVATSPIWIIILFFTRRSVRKMLLNPNYSTKLNKRDAQFVGFCIIKLSQKAVLYRIDEDIKPEKGQQRYSCQSILEKRNIEDILLHFKNEPLINLVEKTEAQGDIEVAYVLKNREYIRVMKIIRNPNGKGVIYNIIQ